MKYTIVTNIIEFKCDILFLVPFVDYWCYIFSINLINITIFDQRLFVTFNGMLALVLFLLISISLVEAFYVLSTCY